MHEFTESAVAAASAQLCLQHDLYTLKQRNIFVFKVCLEQTEKEGNEKQELKPCSSYNIHVDEAKSPTVVGDNSTFNQNLSRTLVVVQNYNFQLPGTGAFFLNLNRLISPLSKR